jgi:Transposase IS116/IS110/IS902 family
MNKGWTAADCVIWAAEGVRHVYEEPAEGFEAAEEPAGLGGGVAASVPVGTPRFWNGSRRVSTCQTGFSGDISGLANRDAYAACNGTAPVERSSGGRVVHRISQRGNRRLTHALHLAAICQIRRPSSDGRAYFERKLAQGKTQKDAIRSLKRRISNAAYRQLVIDATRSRRSAGRAREGTRTSV